MIGSMIGTRLGAVPVPGANEHVTINNNTLLAISGLFGNFFLVIGASNSCSKFDVHYRHQVTTYAQHFSFFTFTEWISRFVYLK